MHHIDGRSETLTASRVAGREIMIPYKRKVRRHCLSLAFLTIWIYNMKKEELKISCETEKSSRIIPAREEFSDGKLIHLFIYLNISITAT